VGCLLLVASSHHCGNRSAGIAHASGVPLPSTASQKNATFLSAIDAIGMHYPCNAPRPVVTEQLGLKYWASEDYSG
jgi:hypothetical protein